MLTVVCPGCLTRYDNVADAASGRRATCPKCRRRFTVPGTAADDPYTPGVSSVTLPNPFDPRNQSPPPPLVIAPPRRNGVWAVVGLVVALLAVAVVIVLK